MLFDQKYNRFGALRHGTYTPYITPYIVAFAAGPKPIGTFERNIMKFLPVIFLAFVCGEIAAFILVGQRIGVVPTLLLLLASLAAGAFLIRSTGLRFGQVMRQRPSTAEEASSLATLASFRMLAGLLLLIPGFLTDVLALVLLIPAVQRYFRSRFMGGFTQFSAEWTAGSSRQGPIIEGQAVEIESEIVDDSGRKPRA